MKRFNILPTLAMLIMMLLLATCKKSDNNTNLSPARNILGTWVSSPVNVYEMVNVSNNCSNPSFLPIYAWNTFKTSFTFVIAQFPPDTTTYVNITVSPLSGTAGFCGTTIPMDDGNLIAFDGVVSSSALTLTSVFVGNNAGIVASGNFVVGNFTFTTDLMTGKINMLEYTSQADTTCIGFSTDQISLTKQ